jgi:hypothetical protein
MGADSTAPCNPRADRVILRVEADSTEEELDEMAEAIVAWIESIDPDFFLPEND